MDPLWLTIAFICGFALKMIGLPPLVGYLIAGFILKFMGAQIGSTIPLISDLGVTLLLFTIGLKIKIKDIAKAEILGSTSLHMAVITGLYGIIIFFLSYIGFSLFADLSWKISVLIAFSLSFSSTVFAVKVLEEKGEMQSTHSSISIGVLIIQDIFAVLFLVFAAGKVPSLWALSIPIILFVIRPVIFYILDKSGHGEMLILYGFFMALIPGAELFKFSGLKPDLGALVIGMVIAYHPKAKELANTMMGFKDIFLIGFFLSIGLSGIPSMNIVFIALILALGINIKVILYFIVLTRFKLRARTAVNATLPLANFSEFGLIIAAVGAERGWIPESWLTIIAIALAISFVVSSPMNTYSHRIYYSIKKWLHIFETKKRLTYDKTFDIGEAEILIFGMGHLGRATYDQLKVQYDQKVLAIDYNEERVNQCSEFSRNVIHDDATDSEFWEQVKEKPLDQVKLVLLCMNDQKSNLYALERLKAINYEGQIAATAKYDDQVQELIQAGIDSAYNLYTEAGIGFSDQVCDALGTCGINIED